MVRLVPSVLWRCWLGSRKGIRPVVGCCVVICLERGADLHMAQLMPLPLTVSCFSKIQIGFTFLVPAHLGSPRQRAVKRVCVSVCVTVRLSVCSEIQIVGIWSSWCQCHPETPSTLASFKSRLVLPFWHQLTQVVPEKRPLNRCNSPVTKF